jgi:phosphoenolpyruvate synthase/pyruvate phosphate dikinase
MKFVTPFKRHYTTQYADAFLNTVVFDLKRILGKAFTVGIYYPHQHNECFTIKEDELENFIQDILSKFAKSKDTFEKFERILHLYGQKYVQVAKDISNLELNKDNLKKNYFNYVQIWIEYNSYLWFSFIMNERISEKVRKLIEEKCETLDLDKLKYINAIFTPPEKTEIAKLREKILENKELWLQDDKLNELTENYSWLSCMDLQFKPWNKEDMKKFVEGLKATNEIKIIPLEQVAKDLGLTDEEEKWFFIQNRLSFIKDVRDDYRREAVLYSRTLYNRISEEFNIDFDDLIYMTIEETFKLIDNNKKIDTEILKQRQDGYLIIQYEDKMQCVVGGEAQKLMDELDLPEKHEHSDEVTGICGSPGKKTGTVKIIEKLEDLHKVKQDDIMIAITTHPDYVPAMSRASAIVTDEGGMTCHAAIVTRELGTPCIVGTKIATKVFKDNDQVEVDADKGLVKKIE